MRGRYVSYGLALSLTVATVVVTACGGSPASHLSSIVGEQAASTTLLDSKPTRSAVVVAQPTPQATDADPAPVAPDVAKDQVHVDMRTPAAAQGAIDRALADLAQHLGIDQAEIEVISVQPRSKPNGVSDTSGVPDGWLISLMAHDQRYQYAVDAGGRLRRLP